MATHKTAKFNFGGKKYKVSRSLLECFKQCMLYLSSSEMWQKDPSGEIFIERDGDRLRYCSDYMRDGIVNIPFTVSKSALISDAGYYGIGMDGESITQALKTMSGMEVVELKKMCERHSACRRIAEYCLWQIEKDMRSTLSHSAGIIVSYDKVFAEMNDKLSQAWTLATNLKGYSDFSDRMKRFGLTPTIYRATPNPKTTSIYLVRRLKNAAKKLNAKSYKNLAQALEFGQGISVNVYTRTQLRQAGGFEFYQNSSVDGTVPIGNVKKIALTREFMYIVAHEVNIVLENFPVDRPRGASCLLDF